MAEHTIVQDLLRGGEATLQVQSRDATIMATHMTATEAMEADSNITFAVAGTGVAAIVPASVVRGVSEDVVILLTVFSETSAATFEVPPTGAGMVATPVSVRILSSATLTDVDGTDNLHKPILVTLQGARPEGARCAFWDVESLRWSSEGLEDVNTAGGELVCATSHLTIFSGFVGQFERTVVCSNVKVLSLEAFVAISDGSWSRHPPAVILWLLLLIQCVLLLLAFRCDRRDQDSRIWTDEDFFTSDEAFKHDRHGLVPFLARLFMSVLSLTQWLICMPCCSKSAGTGAIHRTSTFSNMSDSLDEMSVKVAATGTLHALARKNCIMAGDLEFIMKKAVLKTPGLNPESDAPLATSRLRYHTGSVSPQSEGRPGTFRQRCRTQNSLASLVEHLREEASSTSEVFRSSGFCMQVWVLYTAMQPWMMLGQFSIRMSAFLRALLLTAKVLGALMLSALFFQFSDEAMSIKSAETCKVNSTTGRIWRNIFVGLLSAVLSSIPLIVIYRLQRRNFIYQESWGDFRERRIYLRRWNILSALATALGLVYSSGCTLFVVSFISNIDPSMEVQWLASVAAALLREFLLAPLALAIVYAGAIEVVSRRRPHLIDRVYEQLGVSRSEVEARPESDLSGGVTRGPDSLPTLLSSATLSFVNACEPDTRWNPGSLASPSLADACESNAQCSLRLLASTPWHAPDALDTAHDTLHDAWVVDVVQLDKEPEHGSLLKPFHAAPVGDKGYWLDHSPPEQGTPVPPDVAIPLEPEVEPPNLPSPLLYSLPGASLCWEIRV